MSYVYDKSGQRAFIVREESTYGMPYNPEDGATLKAFGTNTTLGDTPIPADYPLWHRFDVIGDGFDAVIPQLEKFKKYDIGDFKHAGTILTGNYKPIDITFDMDAQALEFLVLAIGSPTVSSRGQVMTQVITVGAEPANAQGNYFLIDAIYDGALVHFAIWLDTAGGEHTTGKPTITGINASNVLYADISGTTPNSTATQMADAIEAALELKSDYFTSANNVAGVITVVHAHEGAVMPARDGADPIGILSVNPTTWGSTNYAISESVDTSLESFTIHLEQRNTTTAEDIVWDLYGCVIEEVKVTVNYEDGIVKGSVTFKCPYALENSNGRSTNAPAKKMLPGFPSMSSLKESSGSYHLIWDGTNDRTPQAVEQAILTVVNNITFKGDIGKRYAAYPFAGKRDITLQIIGATSEKELFTYWQGAYTASESDWVPSGSARLRSVFRLERDATYDYILVSIRSLLIKEHNFHFASVDEAVKVVDMTFEDSTPDTNGRVIDDCDFVGYIDEQFMVEPS